MTADEAHAQMDPGVANRYTVLTHVLVRLSYFDLVQVRALLGHGFLRLCSRVQETNCTVNRPTTLFCDPQIFRERPLFVNPLRLAAEAGFARHLENFVC